MSGAAPAVPTADADVIGYDPFDYRIHEDPYPVYRWMRDHAPVYRNEERDFWALSRHADVQAALRDPARFSNRYGISLEPELWGPHAPKTSFFLAMDPPDHGVHRALVSGVFTPRRVAAMEPRVRELARERLEPLRDARRFDFAADYAAALPNDVLCEMLGIPCDDWDQIRADTDLMNQRADGSDERGPNAVAAALRLGDYLVALVGDLRRRPGDDLTSTMIAAEVGGERLSDAQIVGFLFVMIGAGNESTGKTIGNAWYHGWLRPDVGRRGLDGRAQDWAAETLRYDSASQMVARRVTEDTVVHGVRLPAGARVAVLPASANRDERAFPDPDRYDLDRDKRRMISYGYGPHHCLGAALAGLQMRVALDEIGALVSGYEIDLDRVRRVHSPHQRGFASLPCDVTPRAKPRA
ncbi:cytochrome P450 [Actinoplanes sp. NPDC049316]|uniref:cytochrome P450 n=1 Tax=Actinoplanes sp. NPDC049316 TaxID=3154727 RepID=UPI00342CC8AA